MIRNFLNKLFSEVPEWDGSERRRSLRTKCEFQLEVNLGQQQCPAQTLDVGASGVKLRLGQPWSALLKRDQEATLRYPDPPFECEHQTVAGKIRWVKTEGRTFVVAVGFDENIETLRHSWVKNVLLENFLNGAHPKRKHHRVHSQHPAIIQLLGESTELRVSLLDLSTRGAKLELAEPLEVGTELLVRLAPLGSEPALTLKSVVRRCHPARAREALHEIGISFAPERGKKTAMLKLFRAAVAKQKKSTLS